MDIYIQSRGKNQDRDYRWLLIESDKYYPENPNFLMQSISNSTFKPFNLIESQKQSIILVADRDYYYLLVTGLKAKDRIDFTGRSIRNSILWICQKDSEKAKVRSLLIRALEGKLEQEIDKTINIGNEYGFKVDYKSLVELSNSVLDVKNNRNTDLSCKIGNNSEVLRQEIALELQTSPLPDRNGLLVLVTSIKSASVLKEAAVWRGLSNRIKNEELEVYSSGTVNQQAQKKTIFLGIAIALLLIAIAFLIIWQKPQPEIDPNSPNLKESTLLEKKSGNSSNKELTSIELPSVCQDRKEIDYFLSPCSSNVKSN